VEAAEALRTLLECGLAQRAEAEADADLAPLRGMAMG